MWPAKVVARRGLATLKLTYFNLAGRAELTRLALYIGDIYFEDDRISMQRLKNLKQSLPYGQLPVLMVDDLVMAQSHPIAKYAGTLAGLYPHNEPLDAFKVDEVLAHLMSMSNAIYAVFGELDKTERAVRAKELVDVKLPTMFQLLERRLVATSTGNPYLLDSLSLADLEIYLTVHMLKTGLLHDVHTHAVSDAYPHVMSIYDAIKQHPKVVEWNHRKN
ncbi:hypothetical protein H257_10263 [Aphanomyces astaci]|uniref:GST C-terminal domain-containing protein n=1 Tax=Aphanomyces astaci TaxID=112090 RepID=W4G8Y7_APHAT|nr:hypothetical protein H257_10263 [Aphanomyces astaci]ETV75418.1 hypothetical protein H257_10263 [Aphanomyces astaci]RQM27825.1 hypothetical protein B5M09_005671 [Aphanomyces astaci]|eukprot:XP_009835052.1 hypothetical protein H257_10263 [Aphanomyces astaci]